MKFLNTVLPGILFALLLTVTAHAQDLVSVTAPSLFSIPYGDSLVELAIGRAQNDLDYVKILYQPAPSCPVAPQIILNVKYSGDEKWYGVAHLGEGKYQLRDSALASARFFFKQTSYTMLQCQLQLVGALKPQAPYEEHFAGTLAYNGGFVNRSLVEFNDTYKTQTISLRVPQFCANVEIAEVGAVVGEAFIAATKDRSVAGKYWFSKPVELKGLEITLNGPKGLSCDIPVYTTSR